MIDLDDLSSIGDGPSCPNCGRATDWLNCWNGCEAGIFDYDNHLQYEDPLWYDEDDFEVCDVCRGRGGWRRCPDCEECFDTLPGEQAGPKEFQG